MPTPRKKQNPKPTRQPTRRPAPRIVLLAVTGMSPAILTETLWALAQEKPAIIPDEVIIITTTQGAEDLQRQLLTPRKDWGGRHVWEALRSTLLGRTANTDSRLQLAKPRLIELPDRRTGVRTPADDLRTAADNAAAADFILEEVRRLTENPDTRVMASIAGGRKTMGALLYAAMSLLARDTDRLTHVLVNAPFDICRDFFFPRQPVKSLTAGFGKEVRRVATKDARIELADIPFVPLRNGFAELGEKPGSFRMLVERYSSAMKAETKRPVRVSFDLLGKTLHLDGVPIPMRHRAQILLRFLIESEKIRDQAEAVEKFPVWLNNADDQVRELSPAKVADSDFRRELNHIKSAALKAGCRWPVTPRILDFSRFVIV